MAGWMDGWMDGYGCVDGVLSALSEIKTFHAAGGWYDESYFRGLVVRAACYANIATDFCIYCCKIQAKITLRKIIRATLSLFKYL